MYKSPCHTADKFKSRVFLTEWKQKNTFKQKVCGYHDDNHHNHLIIWLQYATWVYECSYAYVLLLLFLTKISDVISIFFKFTLEKYTQAKMEIKVSNRIYLWSFFSLKFMRCTIIKYMLSWNDMGAYGELLLDGFFLWVWYGYWWLCAMVVVSCTTLFTAHFVTTTNYYYYSFYKSGIITAYSNSSWKTEVQGSAHLLSKNTAYCINIIAMKTCLCNRSGQLWYGASQVTRTYYSMIHVGIKFAVSIVCVVILSCLSCQGLPTRLATTPPLHTLNT